VGSGLAWVGRDLAGSMSVSIQRLITPELKRLGDFTARRSLPTPGQQMVGPFIFFDHLGPAILPPGKGVAVRPHPHINLATVTYLFAGGLMHRDSLGTVQEIQPGAVNWMTAGKGIVHSERSPERDQQEETLIHGIQTWVALPADHEEDEPWFRHYPATVLPHIEHTGVSVKLIAGDAFGHTSPVQVFSKILYLDVELATQGILTLPNDVPERAVYSLTEGVLINGDPLPPCTLSLLHSDVDITLTAATAVRCIVIGGEPLGDRYKWWNFVSSRRDRIEQAKTDWREQRFPTVPGESEFIPLPATVTEANPL